MSTDDIELPKEIEKELSYEKRYKDLVAEIKQRTELEELARKLYKKHLQETTYRPEDEKYFIELRAYKKEYWRSLAQALQQHIREGLKEER